MARNRKTGELVQAWAGGFPGSAAHALMFTRLKERGLETVPYLVGISGSRTERVVFIAGRRRPESKRRATVPHFEERRTVLWSSPIAVWHKGDLRAYRSWQRDLYTSALERWTASPTTSAHPDQLGLFEVPSNPVAKVLGMSGECGCLSYAVPGEVEQWRTAYPDDPFILRMAALEEELRDRPRHSRPPQAVGLETATPRPSPPRRSTSPSGSTAGRRRPCPPSSPTRSAASTAAPTRSSTTWTPCSRWRTTRHERPHRGRDPARRLHADPDHPRRAARRPPSPPRTPRHRDHLRPPRLDPGPALHELRGA